MVSAASAINQATSICLKDGEKPATLEVSFAKFGDIRRIQVSGTPRGGDPLLLMLNKVEPGCQLQVLNLSAKPDASWEDKDAFMKLPGDTLKPLGNGQYGLVLGNNEAKAVGIRPGDVFEIRQVDPAGNASDPATVSLEQQTPQNIRIQNFGTVDSFGVNFAPFRGETVQIRPYPDGAAPTVLTSLMSIDGKEEGKGRLTGKKAIEPGATVYVHNEATQKTFEAKVGADKKFELEFEAKVGAPLHLWVKDHNGNTTDLGLTPYAPKCVKSGPLCAAALAQQV